ncbi:MAG: hypothetical protein J0L82_09050 [Deltaproteobacteria bacterium]|nr:hypothetical protein [Deltaproteobacteria bacterium]
MLHGKSVLIFHPKLERLYFAIFFAFLILMLAMSVGWIPTVRWNQTWTKWIVAFVFFNSLHAMLTWVGILLLPELRSWAKTQLSPRRIPIIALLFLGISLAVTQIATKPESQFLSPMAPYLALLLLILVAMHNVGQTKGMAMLYNAGLRSLLVESEVPLAKRCEKNERWLFNILVAAVFLGLAVRESMDEYAIYIPDQTLAVCAGVAALAFLAIIINSMKYPKVSHSNKTLFSFTAVFHVLLTIYPAAFVFQRALHGVEYVFLAHRMAARSVITWRTSAVALAIGLMFAAGTAKAVSLYFGRAGSAATNPGVDITPVLIFGLWIEYVHYYIDSIMFRMTDADARRLVGPLLKT